MSLPSLLSSLQPIEEVILWKQQQDFQIVLSHFFKDFPTSLKVVKYFTSWSSAGELRGLHGRPSPQVQSPPLFSLLSTQAHETLPADQSLTAHTPNLVRLHSDSPSKVPEKTSTTDVSLDVTDFSNGLITHGH